MDRTAECDAFQMTLRVGAEGEGNPDFGSQFRDAARGGRGHFFLHGDFQSSQIDVFAARINVHRRRDAGAERGGHQVRGRKRFAFALVIDRGVGGEGGAGGQVFGGAMQATVVGDVDLNHGDHSATGRGRLETTGCVLTPMKKGGADLKALIFDFDGLIVDTEMPEYLSWREVYEANGAVLTMKDWLVAVGAVGAFDPRAELEKRTGVAFDWPVIDMERRQKLTHCQLAQPILPGVRELMKRGRELGYRIGVTSNSTAPWVEGGLERLGLRGLVDAVRTVETVSRPKPAPDVYLALLADLGGNVDFDPTHTLVFEDSAPGIHAAKAAGLTVIAVPSALTRQQDLSMADETVESLAEFSLPEEGSP